ncbi:MAG: cytosolic protein [Candidatus Omnitrophica bacterium]|nr:cytosolic protein [Candidatus Omnitrophota bacterium]
MRQFRRRPLLRFVAEKVEEFHDWRFKKLVGLRLDDVLRKKNPYLFKAKALETAQDLVKSVVDAHLSSQEETAFGDLLEEVARFVSQAACGGRKSSSPGIDLEFARDGACYLVSIKSGPNWGNSQQVKRLEDNFRRAAMTLRTNKAVKTIVAVEGCCYGKDDHPDKGARFKYCGQRFWEFLSGDPALYLKIIEPMGQVARQRTVDFLEEYGKVINKFTIEFGKEYCRPDGTIMWKRLLNFNSGKASR